MFESFRVFHFPFFLSIFNVLVIWSVWKWWRPQSQNKRPRSPNKVGSSKPLVAAFFFSSSFAFLIIRASAARDWYGAKKKEEKTVPPPSFSPFSHKIGKREICVHLEPWESFGGRHKRHTACRSYHGGLWINEKIWLVCVREKGIWTDVKGFWGCNDRRFWVCIHSRNYSQ